ncbi:MAG: PCRF domain-containing protein, partial [Cyanobacteriota bacterium]
MSRAPTDPYSPVFMVLCYYPLFRMYSYYAQSRGWKIEVFDQHETGVGGF